MSVKPWSDVTSPEPLESPGSHKRRFQVAQTFENHSFLSVPASPKAGQCTASGEAAPSPIISPTQPLLTISPSSPQGCANCMADLADNYYSCAVCGLRSCPSCLETMKRVHHEHSEWTAHCEMAFDSASNNDAESDEAQRGSPSPSPSRGAGTVKPRRRTKRDKQVTTQRTVQTRSQVAAAAASLGES